LKAADLKGTGPESNGSVPAVLKLYCGGNVPLLFRSPLLSQSPVLSQKPLPSQSPVLSLTAAPDQNPLPFQDKQHSRAGPDKIREGSALGRRTTLPFRAMSPRNVVIGKRRLHRVTFLTPASSTDTAPRSGEDGLLPITLFKRVFISNHDRFVIFDPR